ncbi:centrosomal protein of 131 kDa-like [Planococcus citri]|uniref:centrosomal protein of 131 kDa-like n=1 Tax=Planococcus citri TaxID=170843 RepID=UPI0031F8E02F
MTISKTQSKKKNSTQSLQLSGSQINLSPRPTPVTHITWSSSYKSYPIRRSVSAFGFQQEADERDHHRNSSRPLSADNIRYINRRNFADDFHQEITISSRSQSKDEVNFAETCMLSENVYENILNGYSENKQIARYEKMESASDMKPGLSLKPPLPPPSTEAKFHANKIDPETEGFVESEENLKTATEKEAFDEIIALKFQRWFPNTINHTHSHSHNSNHAEGSSSEADEIDDVELLSYKERNYKTREYRYEVHRKNSANKLPSNGASTGKNSAKKNQSKNKAAHQTSPSPIQVTTNNDSADSLPTGNVNSHRIEPSRDRDHQHDDNDKQLCKETEYENMVKKKTSHTVATVHSKPKLVTPPPNTSSFKKSNLQSPCASPLKKQKKISFCMDTATEVKNEKHDSNDNFVEPYFAAKNLPLHNDEECSRHQGTADMSKNNRDSTIASPQQPAGSQIEDVLSWMCTHRGNVQTEAGVERKIKTPDMETNNSMYEEMIDILKDIEKEDIRKDDPKTNEMAAGERAPSSSAKAIWSLIEEAKKANDIIENAGINDEMPHRQSHPQNVSPGPSRWNPEEKTWNRLSDLLRLSSTELAQKTMSLQLLLDDRESVLQNLNVRLRTNEQTHQQQTQQLEYSIQKQLKLIEQLKNEKKTTSEKMQKLVEDLEKKHATALIALDEKHKVELKKSLEKQAAADKIERDKWLEIKTQKIRDLTIKGLEPELNRMATAHQEEIAEIRKFHKRQIDDMEEAANRRLSIQKEKFEAEKEKALAIEREISRQKLADEIGELEKRYQDQRKRLLAEVHVERENMERQNEATLAIREKDNERKWEKKSIEMHKKIEALQNQHQEEMKKMQQHFESEKQIWMKNQIIELSDREGKIRQQCKKERDKHIELIVQKLENENTEREAASEQKIKRMKEKYEAEIHDLETVTENLKRKLNECRSEIQKNEEVVSQLRAQLNQSQTEYVFLKEKYDRLLAEQGEMQTAAKSELTTRLHILQSELSQAQLTYESQIKMLKSENERELSQMYNKVKEMIEKKDYLINTLNKQKDAALKQCNQLEELLQCKKKDHIMIS